MPNMRVGAHGARAAEPEADEEVDRSRSVPARQPAAFAWEVNQMNALLYYFWVACEA